MQYLLWSWLVWSSNLNPPSWPPGFCLGPRARQTQQGCPQFHFVWWSCPCSACSSSLWTLLTQSLRQASILTSGQGSSSERSSTSDMRSHWEKHSFPGLNVQTALMIFKPWFKYPHKGLHKGHQLVVFECLLMNIANLLMIALHTTMSKPSCRSNCMPGQSGLWVLRLLWFKQN